MPIQHTRTTVLLLLFTAAVCTQARAAEPAAFTVKDSIEMTRLLTPLPLLGYGVPSVFHFSPDGSYFVTIVRKGNVSRGINEYQLLLFQCKEVQRYLTASGQATFPLARTIATFETASDRDAIEQVTWDTSNRALYFLARDLSGRGRVFKIGLENGWIIPLTELDEDVAAYDYSVTSQKLVYSVYAAPDWVDRNDKGYVVGNFYPSIFLGKRHPQDAAEFFLAYYVKDIRTGKVNAVKTEPDWIAPGGVARDIVVSPTGRWALIKKTVLRIPQHWMRFDTVRREPIRGIAADGSVELEDAFGMPDFGRVQYYLVDLGRHEAKPLLDAPSESSFLGTSIRPSWSPSETHVLIPLTYVPQDKSRDDSEGAEIKLAVVVSLKNNSLMPVEIRKSDSPETLASVGWESDQTLWIQYYVDDTVPLRAVTTLRLGSDRTRVASTRSWPADPPGSASTDALRVRIVQALNSPPEIAALDRRTGRERSITDLNPQLRSKSLGTVEQFEWEDRAGRRFVGGLLRPPRYDPNKRYPLVIQGNGFYPELFLIDGPTDSQSPHAARALANRNMVVLQLPDERVARGSRSAVPLSGASETSQYLLEIEAAIEALDANAMIDPSRIGLIGFSRIGMRMHYALTFSKYSIVAATVADSIGLTPFCYASLYGRPYGGGMDTYDTLPQGSSIGASLWGQGVSDWTMKSYLFHLERVRTAIRYEEYGTYQVGCSWEPYAILRRHRRPVEMVHIPLGEHVLKAPWHLLTSKQGNVDWFDFWLNGYEHADATKQAQYQRWRKLKDDSVRDVTEGSSTSSSGSSLTNRAPQPQPALRN